MAILVQPAQAGTPTTSGSSRDSNLPAQAGTPTLLQRLAASGCVQVLVGLESLIYCHPGMGPKQDSLDGMLEAIRAIQDAGVAVLGCFLVGCDGETRDSMDHLAQFLLDSLLADGQLTLQTPFPGTSLYRRLQRQGRLLTERSWSHYTLFDVTYQPDCLSIEFCRSVVGVDNGLPEVAHFIPRHRLQELTAHSPAGPFRNAIYDLDRNPSWGQAAFGADDLGGLDLNGIIHEQTQSVR